MITTNLPHTPVRKVDDDTLANASAFVKPLKNELGRVIVGQENFIHRILIGLITRGHLLVEGVPGLAKTLTITSLAKALDAESQRIQFTPDLLPADVIGTTIYDPRDHTFSVKKGPVFANLVLADEINRAPAKVQSALLEAMAERQVSIGGETHFLPNPFLVMATQNPLDQEGTYQLPEAQMDRFMMKVQIDHPDREEERLVMNRMAHTDLNLEINKVASLNDIAMARKVVDDIFIDPKICDYILDLVFATRVHKDGQLSDRQANADLKKLKPLIQTGASPRATLALVLAAKANAFLQCRPYVTPQDVKDIALDVLSHRTIITYEAEAENLNSADIISMILNDLQTP